MQLVIPAAEASGSSLARRMTNLRVMWGVPRHSCLSSVTLCFLTSSRVGFSSRAEMSTPWSSNGRSPSNGAFAKAAGAGGAVGWESAPGAVRGWCCRRAACCARCRHMRPHLHSICAAHFAAVISSGHTLHLRASHEMQLRLQVSMCSAICTHNMSQPLLAIHAHV